MLHALICVAGGTVLPLCVITRGVQANPEPCNSNSNSNAIVVWSCAYLTSQLLAPVRMYKQGRENMCHSV